MNKTAINYLTHTWNPIAMRCTPVSESCKNCWHLRTADRLANNPLMLPEVRRAYAGLRSPMLVDRRIGEPLKRKKPSTVGTQFMGDLCHDDIPYEMVQTIWRVMECAHWHRFLVLTKRPSRMRDLVGSFERHSKSVEWPPPNIALGVTTENQKWADERIPVLLQTPAAVRFVSVEPMLSAIDLSMYLYERCNYCDGTVGDALGDRRCSKPFVGKQHSRPGLDWTIVGAESGPGARLMDPDWARDIKGQCQEANTRFFMKQMSKKVAIPNDLMIREFPDAWKVGIQP